MLHRRRTELGLDQRSLAELARVAQHTVSNLETGRGNPTLRVLGNVLRALGLELIVQVRRPAGGAA